MTANENSPRTGKDAADSTDSEAATSRRSVLGALGGLAALAGADSAAAASEDTDSPDRTPVETIQGEHGSTVYDYGAVGDCMGSIEIASPAGQDCSVTTRAYAYSDDKDPSHVQLRIGIDGHLVTATLDTEQAREVAADIAAAVDKAEEADR